MPSPQHAMEIFQLLDKSNCRDCGEKTCLAFAGAVFRGMRKISECPKLSPEIIARYEGDNDSQKSPEENREEYLETLKQEIQQTDLAAAARRIGAEYNGKRLTLKILGKNFSVDQEGRFWADIHINPWVVIPFATYVLYGKGLKPAGKWVSFRELKEGKERYPLFQKRCEEGMKRVADVYTSLFDDMAHLFGGRKVEEAFASDISVVLYPLPRVPMMICYWLPEEGMTSNLNLFFDETADKNLDIGSLFSLGAGMTQMFEKLAIRHGVPESAFA
ncbi:MAG: DUF3786 domain-containing protein [Desulfococcaceae bacterium]|nr:DUF3786 domain-containing protein [Desulfococcaceae bacterium]